MTFEEFMAEALHHPERGYYARRILGVGSRGDFTTAPMLSAAPARAISRWARQAMQEIGCRHLIEIGPGEGTLAAAVMDHLPWLTRRRTQLHLVETSAPLAERQRKLLGNRATWHLSPQNALAACDGNAVIYLNELVDAFPVRRFQKTILGWQELAVTLDPLAESLLPPAPLPDSSGFLDRHPPGQWIEVHESYHRFLKDWLPLWKSGKMLTIDYGADSESLYHRRPRGTVRAYLLQQRLEGGEIYQNIGRQDLTADVNFTDLQNWSRPWVKSERLMDFRGFLAEWKNPNKPLPTEFIEDHGPGTAFKVLEQTRT
jgi:SAM-dependent MidA family methyltransferase